MGSLVLLCFLYLGCVGTIFGEKLYGAKDIPGDFGIVVVQYNSESSTTKTLSTFSDLNAESPNKCTFDQDKGILYAFAQNITSQKSFIYGISLTSGRILSIASPPGNDLQSPQMAFDSNSGQLIFTAFDSNCFCWRQYLLDPTTGRGKNVNSVNDDGFFLLGAGSAFDPIKSIQWVPASNQQTGPSYQYGLALDGSTHLVLDKNSGSTPVYSGDSHGTMYAWGYPGKTVTEKWAASDTQTTVLAHETSWDISVNNVAAYSPQTNTMYSVRKKETDSDYFLVGVNAHTGATNSAVFLSEEDWPYCLGYVQNLS